MSDDPIDDYLQALIQEASVPAAAGSNGQATATAAAASEAPIQNPPADAGQPPCPPPAATAAGHSDDLLAELDAAFDQARAGYEQAQSAAAPLATDPEQPAPAAASQGADHAEPGSVVDAGSSNACGDDLLAELDAAFDQARACYEQSQATALPCTEDPLADLDAAFDQARACYEQSQATALPCTEDPLADLDAAFDQARAQFQQSQQADTHSTDGSETHDEQALQAAFDAARADYQQAQQHSPVRPADPPSNRRIPPAPVGPPVLATRPPNAQPAWQAGPAHPGANASEPRRRAAERTSRWLRLRCGQQAYALELLKVQEVVLLAPLLSLRGTPAHMLGIMNLRGQVVPVMDLGRYLGSDSAPITPASRIVVLESEGQSLGLRVSAVDDVTSLTESQIEPPDTARLCRFSNHLFRGVARLSGPPIILLDANALLN